MKPRKTDGIANDCEFSCVELELEDYETCGEAMMWIYIPARETNHRVSHTHDAAMNL